MIRWRLRWLPTALASTAVAIALTGSIIVLQAAGTVLQPPSVRPVLEPSAPAVPSTPAPLSTPLTRPRRPQRIVVLGDSVASGAACNCAPFGDLLTTVASKSAPRARLANEARDGQTSSELLGAVLGRSPGIVRGLRSATIVTVTIGANDFDPFQASNTNCGGATNTDCYRSNLTALDRSVHGLLVRIRAVAPASAMILITGYWNVFLDGAVGARQGTTYQRTSDALTREVNGVISRQASLTGTTYVDLYRPFKGVGDRDDTDLLADDGDHPSAAGHRLIAEVLERVAGLT